MRLSPKTALLIIYVSILIFFAVMVRPAVVNHKWLYENTVHSFALFVSLVLAFITLSAFGAFLFQTREFGHRRTRKLAGLNRIAPCGHEWEFDTLYTRVTDGRIGMACVFGDCYLVLGWRKDE